MIPLDNFYNDGFGWICRRCEEKFKAENGENSGDKMPRYYREGEAESKKTTLSIPIAKWFDASQRQLLCPNCGITEFVDQK